MNQNIGINDLNDLTNDLVVARLNLRQLEDEREAFIQAHPQIRELDFAIQEALERKQIAQANLLSIMSQAEIKSWKTEQATISRATRYSASINPAYKKLIEDKLKKGEEIENWELNVTEYISVRSNPSKK
jgi:hypothetical protein